MVVIGGNLGYYKPVYNVRGSITVCINNIYLKVLVVAATHGDPDANPDANEDT